MKILGMQAVQMAKAGLKGIYLSGWQVAADANLASQTFPDQSLYPADSAPKLVERINNAFQRADQIQHMEGKYPKMDYFLPIVADCEAGFGGPLNAFEIVKNMVSKNGFAQSNILKTALFFIKVVSLFFLDQSRCSRHSFRRPTGLGEEMWSYGRQSPGTNPTVHPTFERREVSC
jgi:hypothetical protein